MSYRFTPHIAIEAYQSLLVVMSIFIGFNSVVFIFYLGKIDDYERNFVGQYLKSRELTERAIDTFVRVINKSSEVPGQTFVQQSSREQMVGMIEDMKKRITLTMKVNVK